MEGKDYSSKRNINSEKSQTPSTYITELRAKVQLTLRKNTIENYISSHRGSLKIPDKYDHLKIDPEMLKLPSRCKLNSKVMIHLTFYQISYENIISYLSSFELDLNKLGIYHFSKYISGQKEEALKRIYMKGGLYQLQNVLSNYFANDSVVYEILIIYKYFLNTWHDEEIQNFVFSEKNLKSYEKILLKYKNFGAAKIPEIIQLGICGNELSSSTLYSSDFMSMLLDLLSSENIITEFQLECALLFVHLSHGGLTEVKDMNTLNRILSVIKKNLLSENEMIREHTLRTLQNIADLKGSFPYILLIEHGIHLDVLSVLKTSTNTFEIELSIIIIGDIILGDIGNVDDLIHNGLLSILTNRLQHELCQVRRKVAWCISNIAAGTPSHVNALIDSEIIDQILTCLNDSSYPVVVEALFTFINILHDCKEEACKLFVDKGIIEEIINVIRNNQNPIVQFNALLALRDLFNRGEFLKQSIKNNLNTYVNRFRIKGGIEKLEKMKIGENKDVYNLRCYIIDKYLYQ